MHPRTLAWFRQYASDHRHPTNRLTHKLAIPAIVFHIFAMLGKLPVAGEALPWLNAGTVALVAAGAFWIGHLPRAGTLLTLAAVPMVIAGSWLSWPVLVGIAVVAWTVQLAGHYVWEKNRPSFLVNALQSLVGPLFFAAILTREWPLREPVAAEE